MNPEVPSSEFDQSAGEQLAALRELLREAHQADEVPLKVPASLDAQIVAEGIARMEGKRSGRPVPPPLPHSDGNSMSKAALPGNVIRVSFRRRLMWLAAAGAIMVGGGWWFRHWSGAPIPEAEGYRDIAITKREPEAHPALPDAGSVSNALKLASDAQVAHRIGDAIEYYDQALERNATETAALLEQGNLLLKTFELSRAEERFSRLLKLEADHAEARFGRAAIWTHTGRFAEAAAELDALLATRPEDVRYLSARGTVEALRGELEAALSWRQRALLAAPSSRKTQSEFHELHEWMGRERDIPMVVASLAAAETNVIKRTQLKTFQATELARGNELTNAAMVLDEIVAAEPENANARYLLSRVLVHQQQYERAEAMLRDLLGRPDPDPAWQLELAHVLHHQGRTAEFWRELEAANSAKATGGAAALFEYATHRKVRSTNDVAFAQLDRLFRESFARHPEALEELGFQHLQWLRSAGANIAARQAVEELLLRGDGPELRVQRAELLNSIRDYQGGLREAETALRFDPGFARAWSARGYALEMLGRFGEAVGSYRRSLLIDPDFAAAAHNLVRLRDKEQQPRRAVEDFGELIEQRPSGRIEFLLWRSYTWLRTGFPARGLEDVESALRLAPGRLDSLAAKSDALTGLGRFDPAREVANSVIARSPLNRVANGTLGLIAIDLGELEEAEAIQQRLAQGDHRFESNLLRAKIELSRGQYTNAIASFTMAQYFTPNASVPWDYRGLASLLGGEFALAYRDNLWLLQRFGTNDQRAGRWLMHQYLALRGAGQTDAAATLLKGALANVDSCRWPYPVLRLFAGELPQELVVAKSQEIAFETLKKTDFRPHRAFGYEVATRASLGLFAEFEGDYESARAHYRWLIEHPDPMWLPYLPMATNRLQGLEGRVGRAKLRTFPDVPEQPEMRLNDGLLVWLPMDRDLSDHGPLRLPVSVKGNVHIDNGTARFPGDGHFLELPHVSLKQKEFSISFWTKYVGTEDHYSLFSQKESDDCDRALYLQLVQGDALRFGFFDDDVVTPSGMPAREQWNHVVFQYSRYRQTIWLNGRMLVERLSAPYEAESGACRIGAMPTEWAGHHEFDGWMRDFRIYGRALAPAEIQQLAGVTLPTAVATGDNGSAPVIPVELREGRQPRPGPDAAALSDAPPFLQIRGNQLVITAPPVQVYQLQFTPDLNLDWSNLASLTNSTGRVEYVDEGALRDGSRFYRVEVTSSQPRTQGAGD